MTDSHSHYLRDLGYLVRERATQAREARVSGNDADAAFTQGYSQAWYEIASMFRNQAVAFQLPDRDLAFEGFDPDELLG